MTRRIFVGALIVSIDDAAARWKINISLPDYYIRPQCSSIFLISLLWYILLIYDMLWRVDMRSISMLVTYTHYIHTRAILGYPPDTSYLSYTQGIHTYIIRGHVHHFLVPSTCRQVAKLHPDRAHLPAIRRFAINVGTFSIVIICFAR